MRKSNICGDERVEAELLDRDTELAEFTLVGFNHVRVGLSNLLELRLDLLDRIVL